MTARITFDQSPSMAATASPPDSDKWSVVAWTVAALLVVVHGTLAWQRRSPSFSTMNDDAFYVLLARSLRHFNYLEAFVVGSPVHVQYPPAYPALLALAGSVFGEQYGLFVAMNVAMSCLALLLVFDTVRFRFGATAALGTLALCVVNPTLIEMAGVVRSEAMFLLLWCITLWALPKADKSVGWTVVVGASAILTALTRTAGLPIIAAVFLTWVLQRRWRAAGVLTIAAGLTVGLWVAFALLGPQASLQGASYLADMRAAPQNAGGISKTLRSALQLGARYFASDLPFALPVPTLRGTPVDNVVAAVVMAATLLAGLRGTWRQWRPAVLAAGLYAVLLVIWPFDSPRFLVPVLPFAYVVMGVGAAAISSWLRLGRAAGPVVLAALVLFAAASQVGADIATAKQCDRHAALSSVSCFSPAQVAFAAALRHVRMQSGPTTPFVAAKEATAAIIAERPVVRVTALARLHPDSVIPYLERINAQYAVVGYLEGRDYALARILAPSCRRLNLERTFEPRTYVFRILRDRDDSGGDSSCQVLSDRLAAWGGGDPIGLW